MPGAPTDDPALFTNEEFAAAMRVQEAPELDGEGEDNFAEPLGLRHHEGGSIGGSDSGMARPGVLEGKRHGRQVFVRIGWLGEGPPLFFLTMRRNRMRYVTVVRAKAPEFALRTDGGSIVGNDAAPGPVAELIGALRPAPPLWRDLHVTAGKDGIVASRKIPSRPSHGTGDWIYDLWLVERIADVLGAEPLPDKKLRSNWKVPYGLGENVPGKVSTP